MEESRCRVCAKQSTLISEELGLCLACIRNHPEPSRTIAQEAHDRSRSAFKLPLSAPRSDGGVRCGLCSRDCQLAEAQHGYCGLRLAIHGRLTHHAGTPARGMLHWYRDALPTNCVADWVCQGHARYGDHNLAVFYASCTFDCLFCQNWHFRAIDPKASLQGGTVFLTAEQLAEHANMRTYCVCFFGGDPASQMPHALAVGRRLAERDVAVCWETNGSMHPRLLRRAIDLSIATRGCIKFDLKALDETLHFALTGASNARTLENFKLVAERTRDRPEPPLLVASTLLVPGYIDSLEVHNIARFIAELNPDIPYALLGFFPNFYMHDLPTTSTRHATAALEAARAAGLNNVRLGNVQLLSNAYG